MRDFPAIKTRKQAVLTMMLTAVLWSSSGLFVKIIPWQAMAIWGLRGLVATVALSLWLKPWERGGGWRFSRLQWVTAFCFMGAQLFFFFGNKLAPVSNVIFLQYTAPLYVIPLGIWFLDERPKKVDWLVMAIIFAGLLMFLWDGFQLELDGFIGNVWAAASGVSLAGMAVGMRLQKDGNPAESILLGHAMAAVIGVPFALQEQWTGMALTAILYMGVFQIGLSFVLYSAAIKHLEALETTLITMLEPISASLLVFAVLGEVPGRWALVGAGLVVVGTLIRARE